MLKYFSGYDIMIKNIIWEYSVLLLNVKAIRNSKIFGGIILAYSASGFGKFIYNFKRFLPLLKNLVAKDFKIKYRRSVLGIVWSVLNPLLTMLVLTQVFQMLLRLKIDNFPTFYIIGSALWNFFSESTTLSLISILSAAPLIKKVYVPKYMFPLEKCIFSLINFLFSLVAVFLVMFIQGVYPTWTTLLFPIPVLYCFVFSCGMCLFLSAITVYFRDIAHFYSVFLTLLMYLTPILYNSAFLENYKIVSAVVHLNPMFYFVNYFRDVMMYNTVPGFTDNLICIVISLAVFALGALTFKKAEGKFILHI